MTQNDVNYHPFPPHSKGVGGVGGLLPCSWSFINILVFFFAQKLHNDVPELLKQPIGSYLAWFFLKVQLWWPDWGGRRGRSHPKIDQISTLTQTSEEKLGQDGWLLTLESMIVQLLSKKKERKSYKRPRTSEIPSPHTHTHTPPPPSPPPPPPPPPPPLPVFPCDSRQCCRSVIVLNACFSWSWLILARKSDDSVLYFCEKKGGENC